MIKRFTCLFISLLLLISCINFSSFAGNDVDLYEITKGSKKSNITLRANLSVEVQINASSTFTKISVDAGSDGKEKKVELSLYKWDKNARQSTKGTPVATSTMENWKRGDEFQLSGNFEAGEYLFQIKVLTGNTVKIIWYNTPTEGIQGYKNCYKQTGSPQGVITFANSGNNLSKVSDEVDVEKYTAGEEPTISDSDIISVLDVDSTKWTFVDGLGRSDVTYEEAGNTKEKTVGIFYWTWHNNSSAGTPYNIQKILEEHPEAVHDYNSSVWPSGTGFWNEPLYGYYTENDDYTLRKHAELLADAGIDFVLFDCTNNDYVWEDEYMNLLKVWSQAKEDGVNVPKVGFMLPFWDQDYTRSSLLQIYESLYLPGLYQDLWFYWEGKPMVMAIKESLDLTDAEQNDIYNFFTFKQGEPSYWEGDGQDDTWGWLHVYPQAVYYNADGTPEMTTVGIAQNANYVTMELDAMNSGTNMGRGFSMQKDYSYTYSYAGKQIVCSSSMENAHYYGINFQEQWDFALNVDPELVFVTGWNEWTVGRYETWQATENAFPDQCNDANSRDIEPSKGELKDYYYYQLVNNVRKYKGMSVPDSADGSKTIDINGDLSQWEDGNIETYNHYTNNTYVRDVKCYKGTHYTNEGIRNDFVTMKAAYDSENFYFYAETTDDITSYTDSNWMMMLFDTEEATEDYNGYEEFEYILGRTGTTDKTMTLERSTGGFNWEKVCDVNYVVNGNVLVLSIPRSSLNQTSDEFTINFKWCDNNLTDGDIMTLYTDGDTAPTGRFAFVFTNVGVEEIVDDADDDTTSDTKKGCFSSFDTNTAIIALCVFCLIIVLLKKKKFYERSNF